jgi:Xaa-Pro aminopeptidase
MTSKPLPTPGPLVDVARARALMADAGLTAIAAHSLRHLHYLSGLLPLDYLVEANALNFAVLPAGEDAEAQVTVPSFGRYMLDDFPLWPPGKVVYGGFHVTGGPASPSRADDAIGALRVALADAGVDRGRVGFELDQLPVAAARRIEAELPGLELADASPLLRELRRRKTAPELARIRRAASALDEAIAETVGAIRVGTTELELDGVLRSALVARGVEPVSISLGAGPRGALVWSYPTDRALAAGEVVRLDITCGYGLYHADLARTVAVAEAREEDAARYRAIARSLEAAIAAVRPGGRCADVFEAGLEPPRAAGYLDFDRHNFGHGIGLEVHEAPALAAGDDSIPAGAALCVESPFYVYGLGAFTAEDMLIVGPESVERLTHAPAELPVAG